MSNMKLAGSYDMVLAGKLRTAGNGEMGWMAQAQHILVSDSFSPYTQQIPHSEPPGILRFQLTIVILHFYISCYQIAIKTTGMFW